MDNQNDKPEVIDRSTLDPVLFAFQYNEEVGPADNINNLFALLRTERMELFTEDTLNETEPFKIYNISEVSMIGSVMHIFHNLEDVRNGLFNKIDNYMKSEESLNTKVLELARCRYIIQEFAYIINWDDPVFYNPRHKFVLYFRQDIQKAMQIDGRFVKFEEAAKKEMSDHYSVRKDFIGLLYSFFEMKLAELEVYEQEKERRISVSNLSKEAQLLEVWLALDKEGFVRANTDFEKSQIRDQFFKLFEIEHIDYKVKRDKYVKKKGKGEFLEMLAKSIQSIGKKTKVDKNSEDSISTRG